MARLPSHHFHTVAVMDRLLRSLALWGNAGAVANAGAELARTRARVDAAEMVVRRVNRRTIASPVPAAA